jgi:hypothetical protein
MDHEKKSLQPDRARARRRVAGLVAQYIHEISQRHAEARRASSARSPREAVR